MVQAVGTNVQPTLNPKPLSPKPRGQASDVTGERINLAVEIMLKP